MSKKNSIPCIIYKNSFSRKYIVLRHVTNKHLTYILPTREISFTISIEQRNLSSPLKAQKGRNKKRKMPPPPQLGYQCPPSPQKYMKSKRSIAQSPPRRHRSPPGTKHLSPLQNHEFPSSPPKHMENQRVFPPLQLRRYHSPSHPPRIEDLYPPPPLG